LSTVSPPAKTPDEREFVQTMRADDAQLQDAADAASGISDTDRLRKTTPSLHVYKVLVSVSFIMYFYFR